MFMLPIEAPERFTLLLTKNLRLGSRELRLLMGAKRVKTYSAHSKLKPLFQLLGNAKCIANKMSSQDFWSSTRGWPNKYYFSVFECTNTSAVMLYLKHPQDVFLCIDVTLSDLSGLERLVVAYDQEIRALQAWDRAVDQLAYMPTRYPQNPLIQDAAKAIDFDAMKIDVNDPRNTAPAQLRHRISDWLDQHQVK